MNPFVLEGRTAEHGDDRAVDCALAQRTLDFLLGQLFAFKILFGQDIVGFCNRFHQLQAIFISQVNQIFRNIGFLDVGAQIVGVEVGTHLHQVNNAAQLGFSPDRDLNRHCIGLQAIAHLTIDLVEVRTRPVHLVHEHDPGHFVTVSLPPHRFRLGLHATHRTEHRDHTIEHPHGALHLDREVHVTRRINDVDLVIVPARTDGRSGDRDPTLTLLLHPVRNGSSLVNFTDLVNHARVVQNPLGRCCFARINVGGNSNISHSFERNRSGHFNLLGLLSQIPCYILVK